MDPFVGPLPETPLERQWCEPPFPGTAAGFAEKVACIPFAVGSAGFELAEEGIQQADEVADKVSRNILIAYAVAIPVVIVVVDAAFLGGTITRTVTKGLASLFTGN